MSGLTRRESLIAGAAVLAAGCGATRSARTGSTLEATWRDPHGTGVLQRAAGEPLIARTELGAPARARRHLATIAHLTDAHVLDASSPARVPFLDRLGDPFQSTFRPQEALTGQVLAGAVRVIRALRPDAVIQGGDLIDNDQANELSLALTVLRGGTAGWGRPYFGVQLAANPDPFYYRPDLDAPRHPGLLREATRRFTSPGLGAPVHPALGDHDILLAGEIVPTAQTRALAVGEEAVWELPPGLTLPPGIAAGLSPDGPPSPRLIDNFLAQALAGPKVRVPADPARRQMNAAEVVARLSGSGPTLDYFVDVGASLRLVVLDLARRAGGSGGLVRPEQPTWLAGALRAAGERWVIVASHQPLPGAEGGEALLGILDRDPRVIAALSGHTHRNEIVPRAGYWLITTASLIDHPQQARMLRVLETAGGGVALETWMLDHTGALAAISRQLAYLDAQGGRPRGFAGTRLDRNVTLYRRAP
ncbi:MAG: metallophosphoesterase [Solirubrobacterales bacterium]|nr:metallophosphoesterase [Solirubrobacterales bacterium]MBV9715472.1 metallophosphoesterase [Solirubrobacterales bacterium]